MPSCFWGNCVLTAAYIINRIPLSCLNFISPYEKLYGKRPNNCHLKVFGCLCFVSTNKQGRKKFDARADASVFIGYPLGQKAYKTYNLSTHKIVVSRDVTFHEQHFPFHLKDNFTSPFSTFYLPTQVDFIAPIYPTTDTNPFHPPTSSSNAPLLPTPPSPAYPLQNQVFDLSQNLDPSILRRSSR